MESSGSCAAFAIDLWFGRRFLKQETGVGLRGSSTVCLTQCPVYELEILLNESLPEPDSN